MDRGNETEAGEQAMPSFKGVNFEVTGECTFEGDFDPADLMPKSQEHWITIEEDPVNRLADAAPGKFFEFVHGEMIVSCKILEVDRENSRLRVTDMVGRRIPSRDG